MNGLGFSFHAFTRQFWHLKCQESDTGLDKRPAFRRPATARHERRHLLCVEGRTQQKPEQVPALDGWAADDSYPRFSRSRMPATTPLGAQSALGAERSHTKSIMPVFVVVMILSATLATGRGR